MTTETNPFTTLNYPDKVGPPMKDEHFLRQATEMHKAAALLKHDVVDKLLAAGNADVDTGDVLGQTPLILLARNHYDPEDVPSAVSMINKLLAAGATLVVDDKIRRDEYGDSPLHLAAMSSGKNGPTILAALVDSLPADRKAQLCSARCKNFGNTAVREAPPAALASICTPAALLPVLRPAGRPSRARAGLVRSRRSCTGPPSAATWTRARCCSTLAVGSTAPTARRSRWSTTRTSMSA